MTEQTVFEILLKNNRSENYIFDYPDLQEESVNLIANNFSDIIAETLKQKSSASNIKRGNVLKFINNLCAVKEYHLPEESYNCYLKLVKKSFESDVDEDVTKLLYDLKLDLKNSLPATFTDEVLAFYKKKHSKQKEKVKQLEFIKERDQKRLSAKHDIQVRKNFSYYQTNESLIKDMLSKESVCCKKNNSFICQIEDTDYREKQVKLAYALINLKIENGLIKKILQRISAYKELVKCEVNFLQYLWVISDDEEFLQFLTEKFKFILERIILKYSNEILFLSEDIEVTQYFVNLEGDQKFTKIRKVCHQSPMIHLSLKNLIFELYCYSFCNENILKLQDFII